VRLVRIGTRGSALALWQANHVRQALLDHCAGLDVQLVVIATGGDEILSHASPDADPAPIPGKGLFTKEIEAALLERKIDLAVHSLKDLPTQSPAGLELSAILQREDPSDAFIGRQAGKISDLPTGASVMTGSPRRAAQLLHMRADLKVLPIRGNVPTRLGKFRQSSADGIILATAGLVRLGLAGQITQRLLSDDFLPAPGQGAIAIQTRQADGEISDLCRLLDHLPTRLCVSAERAYLAAMGGGCRTPIGAWARFQSDGRLALTGMIGSQAGRHLARDYVESPGCTTLQQACELGHHLAEAICSQGIDDILKLAQPLPGQGEEIA
jgi:hydroxymethylbilane synthase